jgi:hypothetical protein
MESSRTRMKKATIEIISTPIDLRYSRAGGSVRESR